MRCIHSQNQMSNIIQICLNNDFRSVNLHFLSNDTKTSFQMFKSMSEHLQVSLNEDGSSNLSKTVIFTQNITSISSEILDKVLTRSPIKSLLIISMTNDNVGNLTRKFESLKSMAFFYILQHEENGDQVLKMVIKLRGQTVVIDKASLLENGIIADSMIDLRGINLNSISISWTPYLIIQDCDEYDRNCQCDGILPELMNVLSRILNFTWSCEKEPDGNWGLDGGHDEGVIGALAHNQCDFALSVWVWVLERNDVMDFVMTDSSTSGCSKFYTFQKNSYVVSTKIPV